MGKLSLFFLISLCIFSFINCNSLIKVEAEYDSITNSLFYNGNIYEVTEENRLFEEDSTKAKNPVILKVIIFPLGSKIK